MRRSRQKMMVMAFAALMMAGCSSDLTGVNQPKRAAGGAVEAIRGDEGERTPINKCAVYRNELCDFD